MDKMNLFTINIIETTEDPEWAGAYNDRVEPTNMVFASVEDAMNKAHEMALQRGTDIEAPEETIGLLDDASGYVVPAPWDSKEETCFIVVPLKWEE